MIIIHGSIKTMEGTDYADGFLEIQEGKITRVGDMADLGTPSGKCYDAKGLTVYPGFIDAHCHLGMWEDALGFEGDDGNEITNPLTPQLRAIDAINPIDRTFEEAVAGGITTVLTGCGSANPIGGQWVAMKTAGRRVDDMVFDQQIGMKFALGENPKRCYSEKDQTPNTRMASASLIREMLFKAQRYETKKAAAKKEGKLSEFGYDEKCEALLPVLNRNMKAFIHCHRADDIFTAIRIGKEFNLDFVLVHATEGWTVADILAGEKVKMIAGPILSDRSKPELKNLSTAGLGMLYQAGISCALCTDHPVIPIQYLPLCAGIAVGAGLPWEEALRTITITAAEIAGIDNRVGSIKAGKDADLIFYRADPFLPYSKPVAVYINGELAFGGLE